MPAPLREATPEPTVLLVEDHADLARLTARLVESFGYTVVIACDGHSALERLGRLVPDAAIIDLSLPDMDGEDLCRRVRADPALGTTALVAYTGRSGPSDRQAALAAGFDVVLIKPASAQELRRALSRARRPRAGPGA